MSDRFFLDTDVLVYSFDSSNPRKRRTAGRLIARALASQSGVVSSQVVQEFVHVATRKFARPMTAAECRSYLDGVLAPLCTVFTSLPLMRRAIEVHEETGYGIYDALVVAAAVEAGCATLYSEDLQDGRKVRGVAIVNPFTRA
jgi:predicted nucleic acid-binding protein